MRYPSNQKPYVWFESGPAPSQWIDPKTAVPATSDDVLICSKTKIKIGCYRDKQWWDQERPPYNQSTINPPLYWMPLPKIPT